MAVCKGGAEWTSEGELNGIEGRRPAKGHPPQRIGVRPETIQLSETERILREKTRI